MAGCICDHSPVIIVDPGNPIDVCADCMYVTSHVKTCDVETAVGPCGDTGTIQLETNCEDPTYTVIYYDSAFVSASIDGDGLLTYETDDELIAVPETYYEIRYKVTCAHEDFEGLTVLGTATICIANLCRGVSCGEGEVCDPCTGDCEVAELNLGLNIG